LLSALHKTPNLTQIELGKTLGLDKTTLMCQLDRLEHAEPIHRQSDPRDRRTGIPQITAATHSDEFERFGRASIALALFSFPE